MCQTIRELIEDSKAEGRTEGRALTIKISKFILSNPDSDEETIAAACDCSIDDVIESRTAWNA